MRTPSRRRRLPLLVATFTLFVTAGGGVRNTAAAAEPVIAIPRPGDHEFVLDKAGLIQPADLAKIKELAGKLLKEKATPIVVLTINSMAEHGGSGMRIETFARLLFDQWGVGHAQINGESWNTGILFLVSKGDRKARIELGGRWRHDQDLLCDKIMNEQIIPRFKQGDFSGGIVAGVEALDKMARDLALPASFTSSRHSSTGGIPPWLIAVGIGLLVFTVVSMIRKGSGGWAWVFWAIIFSILGSILYSFLTSSRSRGGGGFGGGSFGGGFSGGGGSTGSW